MILSTSGTQRKDPSLYSLDFGIWELPGVKGNVLRALCVSLLSFVKENSLQMNQN